jgi:tRNA(fMet)-specific endonuclease VapC
MAQFPVEALDKTSAAIGGNLHAALANKGIMIGERDSMIAAIALSKGFVMVTDNTKEFCRIPELPLENWRHPVQTDGADQAG